MSNDNVIDMQTRQIAEAAAAPQKRGSNSGGPKMPTDDEERLNRIVSRLDHIESEQRTHLRFTVTIAIGIGALIATSTAFLMSRVDRVEDRLTRIETNVNELPGKLTTSLNQINSTLFQAITASKPLVVLNQQAPAPINRQTPDAAPSLQFLPSKP